MLDPKASTNLSSVALFSSVAEHDSANAVQFISELSGLGCVTNFEERDWTDINSGSFGVAIFRLTPLGVSHAEDFLRSQRSYTLWERLRALPRSDWIAIAALVVAVFALFKVGS